MPRYIYMIMQHPLIILYTGHEIIHVFVFRFLRILGGSSCDYYVA